MSSVGTWAWAERTGGRLGRRDQAELVRQGVVARMELLPGPWRRAAFGARIELPDPPDSRAARDADALVRELSTPVLYGHCARTWAFSALFAAHERTAHDPEVLYLACLLHDLGLTEPHLEQDPRAHCFAVEGAYAAHRFASDHDLGEDRARSIAEAISLHLNITVSDRFGAEAALLSKGVAVDAVGRRLNQLPPASVAEVVTRWPRHGSGEELIALSSRQAQVRPQSRAALMHKLGFKGVVRANPLDGRD